MVTARAWTIKGVSDRTRDAVYEVTRATGLTVGERVDRALAKAAEEVLHPSPPAATREDVAEVVREQLAPIFVRLEALEGKADQAARVQGEAPGRPRRRLPEEVKGRIEELHCAGRSAYAISKELGVSYKTVQARVKALAAAWTGADHGAAGAEGRSMRRRSATRPGTAATCTLRLTRARWRSSILGADPTHPENTGLGKLVEFRISTHID